MGHEYVKESDTFSTSQNGTVPKPTAQDVSDGKVLSANGSWVPNSGGGGGSSTLAGLSDVGLTNPSNGQVLQYDGQTSKWINANASGSSGHNYSTTEQLIGTWIDNKPVYELTVDCGAISSSGNNNISCPALASVSEIISAQCTAYNSNFNQWYNIPNVHSNMTSYSMGFLFVMNDNNIRVWLGSNITLNKCYVTFRYTKTTD